MRCVVLSAAICGVALLLPGSVEARGFSTMLPFHVDVPSVASKEPEGKHGASRWEPAPVPHAMAAPPLRRTTIGKLVDFGKQFLPLGNGAPGHDPVTGTPIGAFGPAYQDASLVGHGRAPPGETVGH
ncbi:hypothetical protein ACFFGF_08270 [Asaia lannensis]|uniref:Uncharacterized protein n=1 Tax=Asaia lannensis NBRC 102526 TaxID=1307926 RepID=A0ABT1CHR0_9PROT|nr:hypothetical protein [Asaia lannensis]MCO6160392.1 hypothetical protein [Asaia lannensis NBRC 102526]GBQ97848.1 hypothetical protein AA102526_1259 [Asaia lannensis NBRC 102526]